MSMPFYVAPEQVMADRADYARKGIARGRSLVAVTAVDGIVLCAENSSNTLRKINEIYDKIAFGGVGKFSEFDQLRIAGVRHADLKGFEFSRDDVDARSLANQYAQVLGQVFTHEMKPMEVELLVAEVGATAELDRLFHVLYDGTMSDAAEFSVLGGAAETVTTRVQEVWVEERDVPTALAIAVHGLSKPDAPLTGDELEVAVLARNGARRAFRRLTHEETSAHLAGVGELAVHSSDGDSASDDTTESPET